MQGSDQGLSQHPVDRLIREVIQAGHTATPAEVEQTIERMASAPFSAQPIRIPVKERGASYQGQTLGAHSDSLAYHLIKRVVLEEQWVHGTTAEQYIEDLRRAVRDPSAELVIYERRGGLLAATITPTDRVLPPERCGPGRLPQLLVVYSAERGIIVSGYQFSALEKTGIPPEAKWLR